MPRLLVGPMAGRTIAVLLLMLGTALAGCTDGLPFFGDDDAAAPQAVRVIEGAFDEDRLEQLAFTSEPEEVLRTLMSASFEYTHGGASVDTAALTVDYRARDGGDVQETLQEHTGRTRLAAGDVVTIEHVHLFSGLTIRQDDRVLVERSPVQADWLTATGVPLPIAASEGAGAAWSLESEAGFVMRMDGFSFDDEWESVRFDRLGVAFEQGVSGTVAMDMQGGDLRLDGGLAADGSVDMDMAGQVHEEDEESYAIAAFLQGEGEATLDGEVVLSFEDRGRLTRTSVGGSVRMDATWDGWFEEGGEREEISSDDLDHPLVEETLPTVTEDVPLDEDVPADVLRMLEGLWGLDLDVGDRISLRMETPPEDGVALSIGYSLQGAGRDTRIVDGKPMDTLRVREVLEVDGLDEAFGIDRIETTYWLDATTNLPVFSQGEFEQSLDRQDIVDLFGMVPDVDFVVPQDAQLTLRSAFTMRLTEHQDEFTVPAMVAMQGMQSFLMTGVSGVAMMGGLGTMGLFEEPPADVSFRSHEANGRMVVVGVGDGARWDQLLFEADGAVLRGNVNGPAEEGVRLSGGALADGPVILGDEVELCLEEPAQTTYGYSMVRVLDDRTQEYLYSAMFPDLRACE